MGKTALVGQMYSYLAEFRNKFDYPLNYLNIDLAMKL